jgi:hypothetical protein
MRSALEIAERIGYRHGSWEARFLIAESLRRAGDAAGAKAEQAQAWQIVEDCGREYPSRSYFDVSAATMARAPSRSMGLPSWSR